MTPKTRPRNPPKARPRRVKLTPASRAALLEGQGGCCVVWGCTETRGLIEEHSTPFTWTGAKPDQLMCVACHKAKTRADIKKIAKVRRIRNGKTQADKRKANGSRMKSRGFDKTRSRKFSGEVVKR